MGHTTIEANTIIPLCPFSQISWRNKRKRVLTGLYRRCRTMKKTSKESILIARHISSFLNEYVPSGKQTVCLPCALTSMPWHYISLFLKQKRRYTAKNFSAPAFKGEVLKNGLSGWKKKGVVVLPSVIIGWHPYRNFWNILEAGIRHSCIYIMKHLKFQEENVRKRK